MSFPYGWMLTIAGAALCGYEGSRHHKLAAADGASHRLMETLTYAYLGDWIRRQQDDANNGVPGGL